MMLKMANMTIIQVASLTTRALEAPADVDMGVMHLRLHWLEVFATDDVEASQVDAARGYTEVTDVVSRRAAHTPVHATCNDNRR